MSLTVAGAVMLAAVCLLGAGEAQLNITVTDPSGHNIAFDMEQTPNGQRVIYIPDCPGTHKVNATYCGINVPGNLDSFTCMCIVHVRLKIILHCVSKKSSPFCFSQ